jgi:hypothetical protein
MIKPGGIWVIVPKQKKLFASGWNNDIISRGMCLILLWAQLCGKAQDDNCRGGKNIGYLQEMP